jgi:hypothetical protein
MLTRHYPLEVVLVVHVEHVDGQPVLHAERQRGGVHDAQPALQRLHVRDLGDEHGLGVLARIGGVDALHPVLGHEDRFRVDLHSAQRRRGVGREERVARPRREDHDPALLEVAHRAASDVRLGDLRDSERRLHAGLDRGLLERVLERERVQNSCEHAHVVAGGAVHALSRRRQTSIDVPAADDDRDLDTAALDMRDLGRNRLDALGIDPVVAISHQGLAREFQQHSGVDRRRMRLGGGHWLNCRLRTGRTGE